MNSNRLIVTILALVIVLGGIGWYLSSKGMLPGSRNNNTDWQAVFLDNGQVYFGKIDKQTGDTVTLNNIYYLQVNQTQTADQKAATDQQAQVSLVKLGNELHGPVDSMKINKQHVLFIEQMKSDSKVVDAIARYVANPGAAQQAPALTASPSPTK